MLVHLSIKDILQLPNIQKQQQQLTRYVDRMGPVKMSFPQPYRHVQLSGLTMCCTSQEALHSYHICIYTRIK
jgi:hypothetical protein